MRSDIEIAQEIKLKPIAEVASILGIDAEQLELYGNYKAKLPLSLINNDVLKKSKLILVSAISPTPAGEGKTTMSIGLAQGLNRIGKKATVVLREPSLGPVFGIKGGATGGGYSQVLPMEDINLHFTGDFAAVEKAHNLLSALIDNNMQSKKHSPNIDPGTVVFKRVMDMNDRALRHVIVGLGGIGNGIPRESGFDITVASEVMAILCLSNNIAELKERLGNIFIGYTYDRTPVFVKDLKAQGAMAALLKDAIKPNLVQTAEGTPAIIHGGPFANIAQGTNTIVATKTAMSLSDYVVTEAGFGFDLGGEKFVDIKCRSAEIYPSAVVLVVTLRALRYHGGIAVKEVKQPNMEALKKGICNLEKHLENIMLFGLQPVVAINLFEGDPKEEVDYIQETCAKLSVNACVANVWSKGGEGAEELAKVVTEITENIRVTPKFLYDTKDSIKSKINKIATQIYGASGVSYSGKAKKDLDKIKDLELENLPICIAKTQKSLSDKPELIGRPKDFVLEVREVELAAGAGFIIPITGEIMRMPGLPEEPAAEKIDIDNDGNISGLF
ncbi:MAG: formate--tetrahydrofolate ligase [Prevotellaceae bacterium]|jgi:formate--tetrahydrofolate ligase|nr:formate--tetrahydrofolate ligase [Prevotellaceae bacterium]